MATTNITIRMDEKLKKQAEELFSDLGLSMTTALIAFTKQAVREQRIPFNISRNVPNAETIIAINDV
jgi:DNA-damage-inducible protein J